MKKLTFTAMILSYSLYAIAQDESPKNVVKINPIGVIVGTASLSYERAVSQHSSIMISLTYGYFELEGDKYSTFGLGFDYRYYFTGSKPAPRGWYVSPGLMYGGGNVKFNGGSEKVAVHGLSVKGVLGYQWIWKGGFTLDLDGGIQYFGYHAEENNQGVSNASGVLPAIGIAIGYAFK